MRAKLGLFKVLPGDLDLANDLLAAAEAQGVDYTGLFRAMGVFVRGNVTPVRALFADPAPFDVWMDRYLRRMRDRNHPGDGTGRRDGPGEPDLYSAQPSGRCRVVGGSGGRHGTFRPAARSCVRAVYNYFSYFFTYILI